MKKVVIIVLLALFVSATVCFHVFGSEIRDFLSPKVSCVSPEYERYDCGGDFGEVMCCKLPKEAVFQTDDGKPCIYAVRESDSYPENSFEAVLVEAEIFYENGEVYVPLRELPNISKVVVESDAVLKDGVRVLIK